MPEILLSPDSISFTSFYLLVMPRFRSMSRLFGYAIRFNAADLGGRDETDMYARLQLIMTDGKCSDFDSIISIDCYWYWYNTVR